MALPTAGQGGPSGDALFRALTRPEQAANAEARLRQYIVEHGLRPGAVLPSEAELTSVLGSSRVTVREALRSLAGVGLLESRSGSGWYVRAFDVATAASTFARSLAFHPAALLDLLLVRRATEVDLVCGLAGQLSPQDLTILEDLVDRMRWRAGRGEMFAREDGEFHRRLVAASGNLVALALLDLYWGVMEALYERGFPGAPADQLARIADNHGRIVAALRRNDAAEAGAVTRSHHDEAEQRCRAWLAEHQPGNEVGEDGKPPLESAVMAALLWPGPRG
jgi:DNA-binding FadR family transcriptional regulator